MLQKLLSFNALEGDLSNNSKSTKATSSKMKELRIIILRKLNSSLSRSDKLHANHLLIDRRQSSTCPMCPNLNKKP